MGSLILQQLYDYTDYQVCTAVLTDRMWGYALNIVDPGGGESYVSLRTYHTFRNLVADNGLFKPIFDTVTKKLADALGISLDIQRIDSTHFQSDMKKLSRLSLFVKTTNYFLKDLEKKYPTEFENLDPEIKEKYSTVKKDNKHDNDYFGKIRPSERDAQLETAVKNLHSLVSQFKENVQISSFKSFINLQRIINEQCTIKIVDDKEEANPKDPKEIAGNSLQNPSDPTASFDHRKGQGYQFQVAETCSESATEKGEKPKKNLITYVHVEGAHNSDANALIPAVDDLVANDLKPKKLLGDTPYGSEENIKYADKFGIEVIAPTPGSAPKNTTSLAEFKVNDGGIIIKCPEGQKPWNALPSTREDGQMRVYFDFKICKNCPSCESCPVKINNESVSISYTASQMNIAKHRQYELTEKFKKSYRMRSGIEATNSNLKRRFHLERLRVRGLAAVGLVASLKALALNILRVGSMTDLVKKETK
jgi:hypothetical protein